METRSIKHRQRRDNWEIRIIPEEVPWIKVSRAVKLSGVSEKLIRSTFELRRFGNADYVSPAALNRWITTGEAK
jgi:uncharacterized membrane protein